MSHTMTVAPGFFFERALAIRLSKNRIALKNHKSVHIQTLTD